MAKLTIDVALSKAVEHHQAGRLTEAEKLYCQVLSSQNDCADAMHLLGVLLKQTGRFAEAEQVLRRATQLIPNNPIYLTNLAMLLTAQRRFFESIAIYKRVLEIDAQSIEARNFLAADLNELGNQSYDAGGWDSAIACYESAVKLQPNFANAWNNLGNALYETAAYERAMACYQSAAALLPDNPDTQWNLSLVQLLLGNYREGWKGYEARWRLEKFKPHLRNFDQPAWRGEPLVGRTILLHAEQGLGDAIQFVRYVPGVMEQGGKVVLEAPPGLVRIFRQTFVEVEVIARGEKLPAFAVHCPLMSLPRIFMTTLANIPNPDGYLRVPSGRKSGGEKLKVGIVWAGSRKHQKDRARSAPVSMFNNLVRPEVQFYSLQLGEPIGDFPAIDRASDLTDVADTATVVAEMDLIITVDTAMAHLGGAMGKPTWVLLQHSPDWRWLLGREDSPWYSSVRLFRQRENGDWASVFAQVAKALAEKIDPGFPT